MSTAPGSIRAAPVIFSPLFPQSFSDLTSSKTRSGDPSLAFSSSFETRGTSFVLCMFVHAMTTTRTPNIASNNNLFICPPSSSVLITFPKKSRFLYYHFNPIELCIQMHTSPEHTGLQLFHFVLSMRCTSVIQHLQHIIRNNDSHSNYCASIKYVPDLFIKEREDEE